VLGVGLTVNFGVDREKTLDHLAPTSWYRCLLTNPFVSSVVAIIVGILVRVSIVEARLIVGIVAVAGTLEGTQHVVSLGLPMVSVVISFLDLIFRIEEVKNHRLDSLLLL